MKLTFILKGLAIGTARDKNGSKVMDTLSHLRHLTVDFSYPYIKSTMIERFLAKKASQCSVLTTESGLPSELAIST